MNGMIADMPMDDRPRERMMKHGPKSLSDAELLATLLSSGIQGKNVIDLARDLRHEGFSALAQCDAEQLAKREGMGIAKATRIIATFEIARRLARHKPDDPPHYDANTFSRGFIARSRWMTQEHLGALFLDSRSRVVRDREIYVGTASKAFVSTREVIRFALDANASGVVLYHNHPSGDPSPSKEDVNYTKKMNRSLRLMDIRLVDHIIAGANGFASLKSICKL